MKNSPNKLRRCSICGGPCALIYHELYDTRFGAPGTYDIVSCKRCGLEQTWPRPSESELKLLYEQFYNFGGEQGTAYTRLREWFFLSPLYQLWLRWDGDISFHFRKGTGRLLDVGCNEGRGLTFYGHNGFQAEGLEINENAAALARQRGFKVHPLPLDQFHPAMPYDVVVLSNVLEHSLNPIETLTQVQRLLTPNGQVWISCPNAASYWRKLFGRHWINWHVPFHLWQFSPVTLNKVLARAHFQVVSLETRTPALWPVLSFCGKFASRPGKANRWMRSPAIIGFLMLALRGMSSLFLAHLDQQWAGDCLLVTAQI